MIDVPEVTQSPATLTAVIRFQIPREEIRNIMGPGIEELLATVLEQGIAPAGPVFSHYFRMEPGIFDFEIGVPVNQPVTERGRVVPSELLSTTIARTFYHGGYEGLGAAWGEFGTWIAANGHTPKPDLWESYLIGPESGPDPAKWCTELNRPLASNSHV